MKILWCWRCQQDMPMLEPAEFRLMIRAREEGMGLVEQERLRRGGSALAPLALEGLAERFRPMLEMYRLLTGFEETNPNAVYHHSTAQFGPPCPQCHKPLRTPQARYCPQCGFGKDDMSADPRPLLLKRPDLFRE
ncbi:zinc ribbon domain-containing protein [Hymenobacter sp. CRA2]|uniref:zinc ribbon domain-containing protein n=1 Tax=Hymenobacter sp. CRA2 TaxID=1955620 RepID=UPI0009CEEEEA|nr:zinc ribbon domain-containing protein [Hymenobacter sp. CRA2]OON69013.1 hypothetical protein B0919_09880 [Hymenobacter sp. CRA2]